MNPGPQQEIADLEIAPGLLAFDARVGGFERRVHFRSETPVEPYAEAALCTALLPAMAGGGSLTMSEPISPRVLRTQREFQAIQRAWSLSWPFGDPPLAEVEVTAPVRPPEVRQPLGRVAAFFSGGVDSWSTVLENPDLTDLIFVRGVDILPRLPHQEGLADRVEAQLRAAAEELGLALHTVETNLRDLSEPTGPERPLVRWEAYYGCAVTAVALFLGRAFDRVLIAGDSDYEVMDTRGAAWMVDQLWSNENLEIVDDGGRFSRVERTERIASHPVVRRTLRVCWENPEGAYNCGRCRKCLMTMATLEAVGALREVETFPDEIDLDAIAEIEIPVQVLLTLWEDVLDASRRGGKRDLERAVAEAVAASQRRLGLPPGYRRRKLPGPPPSDRPREPGAGGLLATPETAAAIAGGGPVAVLVGSYDGSGNYGDLAQLDAALGLLERLDSDPLVLPVVERQFAATHDSMAAELIHRPEHVLYYDAGGDPGGEGLVPVEPPAAGAPAISYLYGGGYLNPSWGERKLAMLRAVEELVAGAGRAVRVASGQQVDPGWIGGLGSAEAELLRRFELLGARDDASAAALSALGASGPAPNTGDDAVGVLDAIGTAPSPGLDGTLEVNVHFAEHEWVTDRPDSAREFDARLLAGLAEIAGRPLRVRPLLAYLDPRIDEKPGLERFAAACAERGIELAEPRVLRPAGIDRLAADLGGAALTVSSSYHVALTSLLLAIPTAILRDNGYYAQKARGLLADFGLPPEFAPRSDEDPAAAAAAIAPHLLDPELRARGRQGLEAAAARVRERRVEAEATILSLLSRDAPASAGAAPARAPGGSAEAELRAAEAEAAVDELLRSRSWRITAPLRRLASRRRR
ncbi:MAG TPA: polysaccharide pyruvyl transferase family protein [Solirubrobacterales bacterium]|nr:polysaccharide pyruvyl transferase family protein [Solirubrobacterales bacterium]